MEAGTYIYNALFLNKLKKKCCGYRIGLVWQDMMGGISLDNQISSSKLDTCHLQLESEYHRSLPKTMLLLH